MVLLVLRNRPEDRVFSLLDLYVLEAFGPRAD